MKLELRKAQADDFPALQQMLELYQYELSPLWPQDTDDAARYGFDLLPYRQNKQCHAYVARLGTQYIGFALVTPARMTRTHGCWMEQFFIHHRYRRAGVGRALAEHVLLCHPGAWEIGQIPSNQAAQIFWRRVIAHHTAGNYAERQITQGAWQGTVQQFELILPAST